MIYDVIYERKRVYKDKGKKKTETENKNVNEYAREKN